MDNISTQLLNSCPSAFSGSSGEIFLKAIMSIVTTHCSIFDDYRWPPDNSNEILQNTDATYDYIIIGAGSAGSLLAGQLSKLNIGSVLLVEAGTDPGIDSEIPAFLFLNQNSAIDWHYKIKPSDNSCLGFKNSCVWSKGKGMGGSSSINAMIYVRGHPKDYDEWEKLGNPGWKYNDLKKFFMRQEEALGLSSATFAKNDNKWYEVIDEAWKEMNYDSYFTDESLIGIRQAKLVTKNGKRLNTAKVYLSNSKRLHIMKNTYVQNILFEETTKRAIGVQVKHSSGKIVNIKSQIEVIVSAGTVSTPEILMRSGIGPKSHLQSFGIDSLLDLEVGKNLQDHILFPIFLKTNQNAVLPFNTIILLLLQYMLTRTGPFSNIGLIDFIGFINTNNSTDYPDIQFHNSYFTKQDNFTLKPYLEGIGYNSEIIHAIEEINNENDLIAIYPTLLHPKSRGSIQLSKTESKPIINTNYLEHPDDMDSLINAIEFIKKLENTKSFRNFGMNIMPLRIPGCSRHSFFTRDYWECYIRHTATTIYHPVGTAKMGPEEDKTSVVNHKLLVHGCENLRIVDASVMPSIPSGNTMAPTLVIAQKAIDNIISDRNVFYDEL